MKNMNLVTGGAGFIGSHLVERLLGLGEQVIAVDSLSTGSLSNLQQFADNPNLVFVKGDVTDVEFLKRTMSGASVRSVFHLAAVHYIPLCIAHPTDTLRTNVIGTEALLEALQGMGVTRFVLTSTSDVYAPKDSAFKEDDPLEPLDIHGLSKLMCEQLVAHTARQSKNCSFAAVRLFNPYGTRETNPHVIPHIIAELRRSDTVNLGNLDPQRDFIHVTDAVAALIAVSELDQPFSVFNVGTGVPTRISELVGIFKDLTGRPIRVVQDPERVRSVDHSVLLANIGRITGQTAWRPRHSLRDGMAELLRAEALLPADRGH
jgi:UDP-glucose 4-epimerase